MRLTKADINLLAAIFDDMPWSTRMQPTGQWLANEVLESAADRNAGRAQIVEMHGHAKIAKKPDDDATAGKMANEVYLMADLAQRLASLTDAEAMAAWVRVREQLKR